MAKDRSSYQQGIIKRYYEHQDTIQSTKLSEIVSDLWLAEGKTKKDKLWGKAQVALMRLGVDATQVASVVAKQDLEGLARLVSKVDAGVAPKKQGGDQKAGDPSGQGDGKIDRNAKSLADGRTINQMKQQKAAQGGFDSLEEPNLKRALRAFRRKLKTIRRDDESRLGNRYVTRGKSSAICAITPPNDYPKAVWEKLVELKRLKRGGQGTYELP